MKKRFLLAALVALLIGVGQLFFLSVCSSYIAAFNPVPSYLLSIGVRGIPLKSALFVLDALINLGLNIPAAMLLVRLRPARILVYLALAVIPEFLWLNRLVIANPQLAGQLGYFAYGWAIELLALPMAVAIVVHLPGAPNKSFKPNPLRGSA